MVGQHRQIGSGPQACLQLCRLPVRPERGQGQTHPRVLTDLEYKNPETSLRTNMPGPKGLVTTTEKQVHLGRLHMRPIQWHLKNNWRVPESLEKAIPVPRLLRPHLKWWLQEDTMLQRQALHPLKHVLQIFKDASKEGWGAHLGEHTPRGTWSHPGTKLYINYLALNAVFLARKEFQDLCLNNIVPIATDNTTMVSYINKEEGMKLGPLCALLLKILIWCLRKQLTLKARHIPGCLNMIADKLSSLGVTYMGAKKMHHLNFMSIHCHIR